MKRSREPASCGQDSIYGEIRIREQIYRIRQRGKVESCLRDREIHGIIR